METGEEDRKVETQKPKPESEIEDKDWWITSGIHKKNFVKWNDIIGLKKIKKNIQSTFIYALDYPSLFLNKPRNMLLYGPPGNGKTL